MSKRRFSKEPLNYEEPTPIDRAALELAIEVTRKKVRHADVADVAWCKLPRRRALLLGPMPTTGQHPDVAQQRHGPFHIGDVLVTLKGSTT